MKNKSYFTGPLNKTWGWPMKIVSVTHGSVVIGSRPGEHRILVTRTGSLNDGDASYVKGSYADAIREARKTALSMGEHTALFTHGASENMVDYQVRNGRLVKAIKPVKIAQSPTKTKKVSRKALGGPVRATGNMWGTFGY